MPTIASSSVPPPSSWEEFENICLAATKIRWRSPDFSKNGRPGQQQDGVDIYGYSRDHDLLAIQCKNTTKKVYKSIIEEEIRKAEIFDINLRTLYIATTAGNDAVLQREVRAMHKDRIDQKKFGVHILFWHDIIQDLSSCEETFYAHFPQFFNTSRSQKKLDVEFVKNVLDESNKFGEINYIASDDFHERGVGEMMLSGFNFNLRNWKSRPHKFSLGNLSAVYDEFIRSMEGFVDTANGMAKYYYKGMDAKAATEEDKIKFHSEFSELKQKAARVVRDYYALAREISANEVH